MAVNDVVDRAKIYIYDTTLRDGAQGEGISLSLEDKLKIAAKLDYLGVDYLEGGWPGSNPKDMEFYKRVRSLGLRHSRVVAFGSTRRPLTQAESDYNLVCLVQSGAPCGCLVGKAWDYHVETALGTTLEENLAMIADSVHFLKAHGLEVIFDAEHFFDGFIRNRDYALATLKAAAQAGADWIVLCDTNGGALPHQVKDIVEQVGGTLGPEVRLGIHTHNDGELAVANALAAVAAGARQVQGTINGYGERCGNACLASVIPNLELKLGYACLPPGNLTRLTDVSRYVGEIANVVPHNSQPFVGRSAFAHKGGVHVSGILKDATTYEHVDPRAVGNERRVLISELSGAANLRYKLKELGVDLELGDAVRAVVDEIKRLEYEGFQFEGADASLELLVRKTLGHYAPAFKLESFKVLVEKHADRDMISEAVIKLRVKDHVVHTAAEGNGPVNALDNALRKALEDIYPVLKRMRLTDYKVRVLDEKDGTGAKVRVLIESQDGASSWSTVGVSENIIEASWQALVDSMDYALLREERGALPSDQAKAAP
ncbi:MAG: citramalate synthase [Clostridia bacterium]|nr:citramalate synthase [Clostridia bacterium]